MTTYGGLYNPNYRTYPKGKAKAKTKAKTKAKAKDPYVISYEKWLETCKVVEREMCIYDEKEEKKK